MTSDSSTRIGISCPFSKSRNVAGSAEGGNPAFSRLLRSTANTPSSETAILTYDASGSYHSLDCGCAATENVPCRRTANRIRNPEVIGRKDDAIGKDLLSGRDWVLIIRSTNPVYNFYEPKVTSRMCEMSASVSLRSIIMASPARTAAWMREVGYPLYAASIEAV